MPEHSSEIPVDRPTARLVVIDDADRILLFRATTEAVLDPFWLTPGGGVDPGETYEDAAHRELREETGLTSVELGPWIWSRAYDSRGKRFRERYFLLRTPTFDPAPTVINPDEGYMLEDGWFHWWTLSELAIHDGPEPIYPPDLASVLPPILGGHLPTEPLVLKR